MKLLPDINSIKSAYFLGIGGISMSSLALFLKAKGISVSGYDLSHSQNTDMLEKNDIKVNYEHSPAHLDGVDTVIFSAAIKDTDPDFCEAKARNLKMMSRAELLGIITSSYKHSIGISGTHGKSTTTGMLSLICLNHDKDSAILSGAVLPSLGTAFKVGNGEHIVFEACEYKDSFLSMKPSLKVVLNCKYDHVDYFSGIDAVISSFRKFIDTPRDESSENKALVNLDCENAVAASKNTRADVFYYSIGKPADFFARNVDISTGFGRFDFCTRAGEAIRIQLSVPGIHNISNAVAAAGAAFLSGISLEKIKNGLESFMGVSRRFEKKGTYHGADVFDDYAHHPDEIIATLSAAKIMPYQRIICVFQPHTYSRTKELLRYFAKALSLADKVYLSDIFAAREVNESGISSEDLAKLIPGSEYYGSFEEIADKLKDTLRKGDLLITMGAGEAYQVADILLQN